MNLILTMILLFFNFSCAIYKGKKAYRVQEKILYGENKHQNADIYIPEGDGEFPGVIVVHGGGWTSRNNEDTKNIAKSLVTHGFVVMNINYRKAPEWTYPAQIQDLEKSFLYFKRNAKNFKLAATKIALWGYSSGGHTATYFALVNGQNKNLDVQAVVAGGTPFDLTWFPEDPSIIEYLGMPRRENIDLYFEASPSYKIDSGAPPFFLYHAFNDKRVKHVQTTAFEAKLMKKGIPVERHDVELLGHTTTFLFSRESIKKGVEFLQRQFGR